MISNGCISRLLNGKQNIVPTNVLLNQSQIQNISPVTYEGDPTIVVLKLKQVQLLLMRETM